MRSRKPSPSMVLSVLALFVALGGTGYAALSLPNNSVGSKQIKQNAVTSPKVKPGSLRLSDFNASQRTNLRGPRGAQGAQGPQGQKGDPGRSALTPLQSGETIRGGFAFDTQASGTGGDYGGWVPFPIPAPQPLTDAGITVVQVGGTSTTCTGSVAAPTAPPGRLCVYGGSVQPAGGLVALTTPSTGGPEGSRYGFVLRWVAFPPVADQSDIFAYGTWAYTAP